MAVELPRMDLHAFQCSHCGAHAQQLWWSVVGQGYQGKNNGQNRQFGRFRMSDCQACGEPTVWVGEVIIYPDASVAPPPSADMNDEVLTDYHEAAAIVSRSPRGAAALLRLAIQKLIRQSVDTSQDLNDAIGALVQQGLPQKIQMSLDAVRVIGNEAVHPGVMDLTDDTATAITLFELINVIVEYLVTVPRRVETIYAQLPESKRQAIEQRDK